VQSLVDQLRALAAGGAAPRSRPFVRVLADEVTALSSLRATADRLALLQRVNSDLAGAQTQQDAAAIVSQHATASLGALAAMVFVVDGEVLRSVHAHRADPRWAQRFVEIPLSADLPGAVAFSTGRPLLLRNRAQMVERFPVLGEVYDSDRVLHVVPLIVGERRLGVLSLVFPPGGQFDEDTQSRFVQALADALAQALGRAQAIEEAAAAAERLAFLADASMALTASLDLQQTLDAVTGLLVPRLADWCTLVLLEDGELVPVGIAHTDPDKAQWAWQLVRAYPPRADAPHGDGSVLRTGASELFTEMPDEVLAAAAVDDEHLRLLRQVGMRSALAVPLPGRRGVIGVLSVIYAESGRQYLPADVPFVEDVARRAALAVEAARVLRDQSDRLATVTRVAEAAQQAILAPPPPRVGPVALAARYTSAAAEALVGGDLYETVARDGAVRMLIGDVRGKGLAAVRTATIVLGEFRAAAADLDDLSDVARQIDRRVRPYLGDEDFVTALLAEVRTDGTFTVASCGHPPAMRAGADGITPVHTLPTLPLGLGADPTPVTGRLRTGDRLLLYTDGVLEARDPQRHFVDLMELVQPLTTGRLDEVLDLVLERLHGQVGPHLDDDLALLVAEYQG
jgi:serine phosphatase RsbU (regulator of sigma subunit)